MPHDVFISYSSRDSHTAELVCAAIEAAGLTCWFAPRDIAPGRDWSEEIIDALNECHALVLVFSSYSNDSPQVLREVERGVNKHLPILVFRIEDTPLSKAMEYFLSVPHWFDAHEPPLETHLAALTRAVVSLLKVRLAKPPEPPVLEPSVSATLTFLFTDIEGSTRLWEENPRAMRVALARHDALLHHVIEHHGGTVFKTIGDAFCAVFTSPSRAVEAALLAQLALVSEPWPEKTPLKVRVALHTGDAERRDNDFFGPSLNRVARLLATAHGGQVLLSRAITSLTRGQLPQGATLQSLGEHHLKDLGEPEHVCQLVHPQLPAHFPPLRSMDSLDLRHNLPQQVTRFIGREQELALVTQLLQDHRLVTLTGSGGTGKTRLCLQLAADSIERFPDGVWLVELAQVSEGSRVAKAVADTFGLKEQADKPTLELLVEALRAKAALLILDNCEHLLWACAQLADAVLRRCPGVKLLTSSREALGMGGEYTFRVPSLSLPGHAVVESPESLLRYESVQLFADRAKLVSDRFEVTTQNSAALASICRRLDGIPLALELAAARVRSLPVVEIEKKLDQRFRLLTGGSRTALPRQQTLRSLIDWSYDLLGEAERVLLSRLAVFVGGCTLEAAEQVCAGGAVEDWETLDLLTQLCDKSLLVYSEESGSARYRLLETVRQYAQERLVEREEAHETQQQHRDYFLALAESISPRLSGSEQARLLSALELDAANLRQALGFCQAEPDGAEQGLRLGTLLSPFWRIRGHLNEARACMKELLSHPGAQGRTALRADALNEAGVMALYQSDYASASALHQESLLLMRELGDQRGIANALHDLGSVALHQGDYAQARARHEESLPLRRELQDKQGVASTLGDLGQLALLQGDPARARALHEESLVLRRALGDKHGIASALGSLGSVALFQQDYVAARSWYESCLALMQELGNRQGAANAQGNLAMIVLLEGDATGAAALFQETLIVRREVGDRRGIANSLYGLGRSAQQAGDFALARAHYEESLALMQQLGDKRGILQGTEALASLATDEGNAELSTALWSDAQRQRQALGIVRAPHEP